MGAPSSYHREPCSHEVLVCFAQPRAFKVESEVIFSASFSLVRSEAAAGRTLPNTPSVMAYPLILSSKDYLVFPQKMIRDGYVLFSELDLADVL
jgi:hypothetical protein